MTRDSKKLNRRLGYSKQTHLTRKDRRITKHVYAENATIARRVAKETFPEQNITAIRGNRYLLGKIDGGRTFQWRIYGRKK